MTTMLTEVYDAFKEANVSEETARKAASVLADYDREFADVRVRLGRLTTATSIMGVAVVGILLSQFALWSQISQVDGHLTQIGSQVSYIEQMLTAPR